MKHLHHTLLLLTALLTACTPKVPTEADMGAYLMVYFTDPTHSLHMAISRDGYTFKALNSAMPVISGDTIAQQHGIRDPHIYRGPDGAFYMAMTDLHIFAQQRGLRTTQWERPGHLYGWGNNRSIILMRSTDLINWTHHTVRIDQAYPQTFSNIGCAWAPQTIYDPVKRKMMVYFTIRPTGHGRTALYYAYTDPDFTRLDTEPKPLFQYPDTNIQTLDADIHPMPDGRWCMTYVAQENPGGIKIAISDSLHTGYVYQPHQIDAEPKACEAPNIWKRIGTDTWVLMYDIFSINPHNFGFCETTDFRTFRPIGRFNQNGPMTALNFRSPKHGAVIQITTAEADRLEQYWDRHPSTIPLDSILLSDPCVIPYAPTHTYYMTGSGGRLWKSHDLHRWSGPMDVVHHDPDSWMGTNPEIWAAEIHQYQGRYYYFATFTNNTTPIDTLANGTIIPRRASHILIADHPEGPYRPISPDNYLPPTKATLDATLWTEPDSTPWMIYCHEWLQRGYGTIEAIPLKHDLSAPATPDATPTVLFEASASPWSREIIDTDTVANRVTDGPWLFRTATGRLGMLWTSWVFHKYTQGVAYSTSGTIQGPWIHQPEPITPPDHGHAMIFTTFEGQTMMSLHTHRVDSTGRYIRHPRFLKADLSGNELQIAK